MYLNPPPKKKYLGEFSKHNCPFFTILAVEEAFDCIDNLVPVPFTLTQVTSLKHCHNWETH